MPGNDLFPCSDGLPRVGGGWTRWSMPKPKEC